MILKARWWVDREFELRGNARIEIDSPEGGEVDLGESILFPGLFNAHVHLDYTDFRGAISPGTGFVDWIQRINKQKRVWTLEDYRQSIVHGLYESLQNGTTSMINWICHPETIPERSYPMRIWWLWEQILFRQEDRWKMWENWAEKMKAFLKLWKGGIAPHAPYTCTPETLVQCVDWSGRHHLPWSIHVGESVEESEMFKEGRGELFEMMKSLGRAMSDCGRGSSIQWMIPALGRNVEPMLWVHLNQVESQDWRLLEDLVQSSPGSLSVVHCPCSHSYFERSPFPYMDFKERGIQVCLGTDSLASNHRLSMFSEMRRFYEVNPTVEPMEILKMSTLNGARAVGMGADWKAWQDWVAIPFCGKREEVFRQIVTFTGLPRFVMVDRERQI